jgi:peptidyl-prolyl cis-trans isomerase SurA
MKWQCFAALAFGCVFGCQPDRNALADNGPGQAVPAALTRSQKPEGAAADRQPITPANFLDRPPEGPGEKSDSKAVVIWATVNGVPIFENEIQNAAYGALAQISSADPDSAKRRREVMEKVLEMLIERELVLQDAYTRLKNGGTRFLDKLKEEAAHEFESTIIKNIKDKTGRKTTEEIKSFLKQQGASYDGLKAQFERQFIYQEYLRWRVGSTFGQIGHDQLLEYYHKHPEEFQTVDSVEWQDIFIAVNRHPTREAARAFAEHLAGRARNGEDFLRLCMQYDNGNAHDCGGEGTGRRHGEIRPVEAEAILFAARDGDVALVELTSGFHVFRLVKREYAGLLPFNEKTQAKIRDKLRGEIFTREAKKFVADLKRHATIDIANNPP